MDNSTNENSDIALFYGILAGDGCLSRSGRDYTISITCSVYDDEPFIKYVVLPLVIKIRKKQTNYKKRFDQGKIEIKFGDKELFTTMKFLGFPVGHKTDLEIPCIFNKSLYPALVSGYFATDGCLVLAKNNGILYPRIEIQCVSSKILYQITDFLVENGLKGKTYRLKRRSGIYKDRVIYRMQFNGRNNLIRFKDLIGFINPKHIEKLQHYNQCRCSSVVRAPH